MKKFIVEDEFWDLFPKAKLGVVVFKDIDNTKNDADQYKDIIKDAEEKAMTYITKEIFSENEVVQVWREAFRKFKTKKGARSSIEALLKRVEKGNHIGGINPLVDIYNSISLKYALPCGGEDIDSFHGNLRLTKSAGDENFITLGSEKSAPPYEGEIIYKDDKGSVCRCWNWREAVRTMLTENTKNAFLCIESVDENRVDDLQNALNELASLVEENLGGSYKISTLDINNREIIID